MGAWFFEAIVSAGFESLFGYFIARISRQRQDAQGPHPWILSDKTDHLEPVNARQMQIKKKQVRVERPQGLQPLLTGPCDTACIEGEQYELDKF